MEINDVNAAINNNKKKIVCKNMPPITCEKTSGKLMNVKDGPPVASKLNAKTAEKMIMPAKKKQAYPKKQSNVLI